jgi:hypothetical protein
MAAPANAASAVITDVSIAKRDHATCIGDRLRDYTRTRRRALWKGALVSVEYGRRACRCSSTSSNRVPDKTGRHSTVRLARTSSAHNRCRGAAAPRTAQLPLLTRASIRSAGHQN